MAFDYDDHERDLEADMFEEQDEQEVEDDDDHEWRAFGPDYAYDNDEIEFADPGGNSALRAAGPGNPRNLPCPTCEMPNRLTPADVARGYQCDACADRAERGGY